MRQGLSNHRGSRGRRLLYRNTYGQQLKEETRAHWRYCTCGGLTL